MLPSSSHPSRGRNRWFDLAAAPRIIAHRGASIAAPENSLAAFRRAREEGADGVELDVMICRSGEVIVFHDDDLRRLGGRPEAVRTMPLSALRQVVLHSGARIPTLDEALEEIGPELLVNVELKAPVLQGLGHLRRLAVDPVARATALLLRRAPAPERFLVSSFDPFLLWRFSRAWPECPIALLLDAQSSYPLRRAWPAAFIRPEALHPDVNLVDGPSLGRWRRRGLACNVWTVDDPREIRWLAALGVDGIITNRPAEARRALEPVANTPGKPAAAPR